MATYPLTFPTVPVATERFVLDKRQQAMESPFTFSMNVIQTASRWALEWSFPRMSLSKAEAVNAWALSLNGQVGTFRFYPNQIVRSTLTGRTLALQTYAYSKAIKIAGYAASASSTLRVGQWFMMGGQILKIVEASANADASGQVTISFEPELRAAYSPGTAVEFVAPYGLFRLASAAAPTYTLDMDKKPDFGTIQAIEVVSF